MARFIRNIVIFSFLMLVGLGACEYYARRQPDVYSGKADYVAVNGGDIETLFIGSSLTYWGVAPNVWDGGKAYNLAFNGQTIDMVYYLLKRRMKDMPNLERVILEVAYFTFFDSFFEDTEHWAKWIPYEVHLDVGRHPKLSRYGFEISCPPIFRQKVVPWAEQPLENCDSLGHADYRNLSVRSTEWKSSKDLIIQSHTISDWENVSGNYNYFAGVLELCRRAGVEVIVCMFPAHESYYTRIDPGQLAKMYELIGTLKSRYGFRFLDYFKDARFNDGDFFDVVHLNNDVGAHKFTRILHDDIMKSF